MKASSQHDEGPTDAVAEVQLEFGRESAIIDDELEHEYVDRLAAEVKSLSDAHNLRPVFWKGEKSEENSTFKEYDGYLMWAWWGIVVLLTLSIPVATTYNDNKLVVAWFVTVLIAFWSSLAMYETEKSAAQFETGHVRNLWCALCRVLADTGRCDPKAFAEAHPQPYSNVKYVVDKEHHQVALCLVLLSAKTMLTTFLKSYMYDTTPIFITTSVIVVLGFIVIIFMHEKHRFFQYRRHCKWIENQIVLHKERDDMERAAKRLVAVSGKRVVASTRMCGGAPVGTPSVLGITATQSMAEPHKLKAAQAIIDSLAQHTLSGRVVDLQRNSWVVSMWRYRAGIRIGTSKNTYRQTDEAARAELEKHLIHEEPELWVDVNSITEVEHAPQGIRIHHLFPYQFQSAIYSIGLTVSIQFLIQDILYACKVRETGNNAGIQSLCCLIFLVALLAFECSCKSQKLEVIARFEPYLELFHHTEPEHFSQLALSLERLKLDVRTRWVSRQAKMPCRLYVLLFFFWYSVMAWKIAMLPEKAEQVRAAVDGECDFGDSTWLWQWLGWVGVALFLLLFGLLQRYSRHPMVVIAYDNFIIGVATLMLLVWIWNWTRCWGETTALVIRFCFVAAALSAVFIRPLLSSGSGAISGAFSDVSGRFLILLALLFSSLVLIESVMFPITAMVRASVGCDANTDLTLGVITGNSTSGRWAMPALKPGVRFNETVMVGLHNSYHQKATSGDVVTFWKNSYPSLTKQLEYGYREFEIDIHLDGGGFFRVYHVRLFDESTSCSCLAQCLQHFVDWSNRHPGHSPGVIHIEPRGFNYNNLFCDEYRGLPAMRALRDEIVNTLGQEKLFVPAQLLRGCPPSESDAQCMARVPEPNILAALAKHGWPLVSAMSGRFVVSMNLFGKAHKTPPDGNEDCRRFYLALENDPESKTMPFGGMPLFTRTDDGIAGAASSNYSAFEERDGTSAQTMGRYGMIMRWVFIREPDKAQEITDRFANFPSQLINYHNWVAA